MKWLEDHGYEVIRWAGTDDPNYPVLWPGARAMKEVGPIRSRWEIYQFRQRVEAEVRKFLGDHPDAPTPGWIHHDLAYYL